MIAGSITIIAGTGAILKSDIWGNINKQMHEASPELGLILVQLVQDKTPVLSGSLLSDMTFEAYTDPDEGINVGESDLVWVYAETIAQESYWNRVYVQYQEGGILGEPTYTNPPREMFFQTATVDGLEAVGIWAELQVETANALSVLGLGVPWSQPTP